MINNPIQFAVVREDPLTEAALVKRFECQSALVIASGGCTALSLRSLFPNLHIGIVDLNAAQVELVQLKLRAGAWPPKDRARQLNVGTATSDGLNTSGNFESLFSSLRAFLHEFVATPEMIKQALEAPDYDVTGWFDNPYWPVAFELFLSETLLNVMFGPAATQHAPKNSYPAYFQRVFEAGLRRSDRVDNYFLHHLLLGHYQARDAALPQYICHPPAPTPAFDAKCGTLDDVPNLGRFDLISISNIMDWLDETEQQSVATTLSRAKVGAVVLTRQLNNERDLGVVLGASWVLDEELSASLLKADRSLFYNRIAVYRKAT